MTLDEFALRLERAGLRLSPADIATLHGEIASSCRIVATMAEQIRTRLTPADEPAHVFRRESRRGG
jgi:hypothetical protein